MRHCYLISAEPSVLFSFSAQSPVATTSIDDSIKPAFVQTVPSAHTQTHTHTHLHTVHAVHFKPGNFGSALALELSVQ